MINLGAQMQKSIAGMRLPLGGKIVRKARRLQMRWRYAGYSFIGYERGNLFSSWRGCGG